MKRKDLLQQLKAADFQLKEGGRHTKVYRGDVLITRHSEIKEFTVRKILKDAGLL